MVGSADSLSESSSSSSSSSSSISFDQTRSVLCGMNCQGRAREAPRVPPTSRARHEEEVDDDDEDDDENE